jgi:hypothetical protein
MMLNEVEVGGVYVEVCGACCRDCVVVRPAEEFWSRPPGIYTKFELEFWSPSTTAIFHAWIETN